MFVGRLGQLLGDGLAARLARILPTYYLAEGVVNASQNSGAWNTHLIDIGIILGSTALLLAISAWALRRQSSVLAVI
jgi:hypothetical protein